MIQARNKNGKSANVGIEVDEFKPPVFTETGERVIPPYVNSDNLWLNNVTNRVAKQQNEEKLPGYGHILNQVVIKDKQIIKDSKNLNGPGGADQTISEKELLKAGKMTLYDLLRQKIKGFGDAMNYKIYDEPVYFVFDGMILNRLYAPTGEINGYYYFVKQYLDYYTADDIKGIEIMFNMRYNAKYIINYLSPRDVGASIAFIEITTRSGKGPYMTHTPGTYLYKPLAATLPEQFYKPKYNTKSLATGMDVRPTIDWEPNVVTDTAGRATVWFYSTDKPGSYTITMEGADLNGALGFKRQKIQVQ